jgi:transposase-like protein
MGSFRGVRGRVADVTENSSKQAASRRSVAFGNLLALAVQRYLSGYSVRAAAEAVGVGATTVFDELVRRGIRRRSPNKRAKFGTTKEAV